MRLTQKIKTEVLQVYATWLESYLTGDVETYDSYLDNACRFIGSTNNEEFLSRKEATEFFRITADQFAGKMQLKNEAKTVAAFGELIFLTHAFDCWFPDGEDWLYYGRFRCTSVLRHTKDGWRFIYQHFSTPDGKAREGETIGYDQISAENLQLREAIKRRTVELEEKNRELGIEAALEKVRSRSLAMHRSDELNEVVKVLFEKMTELQVPSTAVAIQTFTEGSKDMQVFVCGDVGTGLVINQYQLPYFDHPIINDYLATHKKNQDFFVGSYPKKEKDSFYEVVLKRPELKDLPAEVKSMIRESEVYQVTMVPAEKSLLAVNDFQGNPLSENQINILKRFARAFDQAYTRFLDLQKAEEQAREAKIETALEKVRSRSLAMQKSDELQEVIQIVYAQFADLGMHVDHTGFIIDYPTNEDMHIWLADRNGVPSEIRIPYFDAPHWNSFVEAKKKGHVFFVNHHSFEEKNTFYNTLFELIPGLSDEIKRYYMECPGLDISTVLMDNVGLYVERFSGIPFTEDENQTLKRFGKVFQQAYTRFLDLQKAEAQTREAQINLAVERVRARALAMFKSEEILEVVYKLKEEIMGLDIPNVTAATIHLKEPDGSYRAWDLTSVNEEGNELEISLDIRWHMEDTHPDFFIREVWDRTEDYFVVSQGKDRYKHTVHWLQQNGHSEYAEEFEEFVESSQIEKAYHPTVPLNNGRMCIDLLDPPAPEIESILKKMGGAFDLAYKRFEDLQKAEEQVKESNIQLALERIRAKTMAMKTQGDLLDIIELFGQQLNAVGIEFGNVTFIEGVITKTRDWDLWSHSPLLETPTQKVFLPYIEHPYFTKTAKAVEEYERTGRTVQVKSFTKKEKDTFIPHYLKHVPGHVSDEVLDFWYSASGDVIVDAFFEEITVSLVRNGIDPYTDEELEIFERFAKEFRQTYIRFLDIKKAETQTRESEIQLALERIRAATMAMHHSGELSNVLSTLFEQFDILGINPSHAVLTLIDKEKNTLNFRTTGTRGYQVEAEQEVDLKVADAWVDTTEKWKKSNPNAVNVNEYPPEILPEVWEVYSEILAAIPEKSQPRIEDFPEGLFITEGYCRFGYIGFAHNRGPTEEEKDIVRRIAAEFGTLYQRFLDLQKAEAQARESQIEAALEKVRSRSLAMQKPEELQEVVAVVAEELQKLGVVLDVGGVVLCTYFKDSKDVIHWTASDDPKHPSVPFFLPYFEDALFDETWASKLSGEPYFARDFSYEVKNAWFEKAFEISDYRQLPEDYKKQLLQSENHGLAFAWAENSAIMVPSLEGNLPSEAEKEILIRFARVFEQAYIRFMDLQKAEAQARESKIEMALEKVRSRTMAMQKGEELKEVAVLLYKELIALGVTNFVTCGYVEINEETQRQLTWVTAPGGDTLGLFYLPLTGDATFDERYAAWKNQQTVFRQTVAGEVRSNHLEYAITTFNSKEAEEMVRSQFPDPTVFYCFNFSHGYLHLVTGSKLEEEEELLLARFTRVFEQTYARFLDLQKAEAQAREAEIQLALERVRARSMAMQNTDELHEVLSVLFRQFDHLGIQPVNMFLSLFDREGRTLTYRASGKSGTRIPAKQVIQVDTMEALKALFDKWLHDNSDSVEVIFYPKEVLPELFGIFSDTFAAMPEADRMGPDDFPDGGYSMAGYTPFGYLGYDHQREATEEEKEILSRFCLEFTRVYQRFLDIQKAEAQAREAQIEVSLERLRSKAMSMQQSDELHEVLAVLFEQFDFLGIRPMSTHMTILDLENNTFTFRETGKFGNRSFGEHTFALDAMDTWKDMVESWQKTEPFTINRLHFPKENLPQVWEVFRESFASMPEESRIRPGDYPDGIYHTAGKHPFGYIGMNQVRPATEEEEQIVIRFANEFGRVYQRFLDLQKAEGQAREARIEAALEKVRARTMGMQHSDELPDVALLLFNEVRALGVPAWSSGFNILAEDKKSAAAWMSSEGTLQKPFTLRLYGEASFEEMGAFARGRDPFLLQELGGKALEAHYDYMKSFPDLQAIFEDILAAGLSLPTYQINHLCKFTHGFLLFITYEPVPEAHEIFRRFTTVFEQTYTRFLDLSLKEKQAVELIKEKQRLEQTLKNLKATQTQLVHAEKMASLGELTAGIAHEIQNPLNFVNNFSELNTELVEEACEELEKGDIEETKAILKDLGENSEKINHHGKRADSIVKGMLQHSRSSDGKKQPTDLNALADEYFRLAYHGLRAKDKSFNATMETDFDPKLPKVDIIPQDIGRVLLNLFTNAFHAVDERKANASPGFQPTVQVKTLKTKEGVEISVRDNGGGIPESIKDKIFQPFFTTKPTGEGTGLGLSMSYDIVTKGHGGHLKMASDIGEGTEFLIILPQ